MASWPVPAAQMEGQLPQAEKEARVHKASEVAKKLQNQYLQSWIGKTASVLVERIENGMARGHSETYLETHFPAAGSFRGQVIPVTVTKNEENRLLGVIKPEKRSKL